MNQPTRKERAEQEFKSRARALLDELDRQTGPENLPDWNIRAETLLMFEFCRRIGEEKESEVPQC